MNRLNRKKQTIRVEGSLYTPDMLLGSEIPAFASDSEFHRDLHRFLKEWFSHSPLLKVKTSGSTGQPKEMLVEKARMMQSAVMTCEFLGLKEGDKSLLCMPLDYIAGKMMVVRALTTGLDLHLVTPSGHPLKGIRSAFDFAAMTPMQVYNSLQLSEEKEQLKEIRNLIIGGGPIDACLEDELKTFPNKVYSTYGMTETLSHIAMRRLNGDEASEYYTPFPSVSLSLSDDNTLIIDAPLVAGERLFTNDVAQIRSDGSFRIAGRRDNIINSGGIKIQAEAVEELVRPFVRGLFTVTSLPDEKFGEIIVLVTEGDVDEALLAGIEPAHFKPKKVIRTDKIPLTVTGKINRNALKKLANEHEHTG
jgi:O-succinylbenzoic acid--CoA ligase